VIVGQVRAGSSGKTINCLAYLRPRKMARLDVHRGVTRRDDDANHVAAASAAVSVVDDLCMTGGSQTWLYKRLQYVTGRASVPAQGADRRPHRTTVLGLGGLFNQSFDVCCRSHLLNTPLEVQTSPLCRTICSVVSICHGLHC
jgi:hypothetical protein